MRKLLEFFENGFNKIFLEIINLKFNKITFFNKN